MNWDITVGFFLGLLGWAIFDPRYEKWWQRVSFAVVVTLGCIGLSSVFVALGG
jgi:hypothetical protein